MVHFHPAHLEFIQIARQPDDAIDLTLAAFCIAQRAYPDLEVAVYLERLQEMAATLQGALPEPRYPLKVIQTINRFLYETWGFQGNKADYYDPRNSFLNEVLDRRTGIPITLATVYLDLAQRLAFPMVGIGMPGHFLIRPDFDDAGIFVDAFNQGQILFEQDCAQLLSKIYQRPIQWQPELVQPVPNRAILARMLTNLKFIYLNCSQLAEVLWTVDWILTLYPDLDAERKTRGLLHFELHNWSAAKVDLEHYLGTIQNPDEIRLITQILTQIQQQQSRL